MAQVWSVLSRQLSLPQLAWLIVTTFALTVSLIADGPTAVAGTAAALVLVLVAFTRQGSRAQLRLFTEAGSGPPRDERRLRGAFRRQSAADTPGRPRLPRAPGRVPAA